MHTVEVDRSIAQQDLYSSDPSSGVRASCTTVILEHGIYFRFLRIFIDILFDIRVEIRPIPLLEINCSIGDG